jgi:hypothetical protein
MPIFDQFETEPYATYSGSYTDNYIYGSIFNSSPAYSREVIALKTTGIVSSSFYSKDLSRSDQLGYTEGNYISSKTQNILNKFFDISEYIFDSIIPSPIGIGNVDNTLNPYLQTTSSWKQIFSASLSGSSNLGRSALTDNSFHTFFPAQVKEIPAGSGDTLSIPDINNFTNNKWLNNFPFQSRYRQLRRFLGVGLDNTSIEVDIYSGSFVSPVITTKELGSLFYVYGDASYRVYTRYSQFWVGLGLKNDIQHVHIPTRFFNPIQKICFTNYSGSQNSCYVAFGDNGTILTSSLGYPDTWEPICFGRDGYNAGEGIASVNEIEIDSWPFVTNSIRDALALGYSPSGKDGCHWQWLLVVEDINRRGKIVRTKPGLQGNADYKIPTKNQWEYVNLDASINFSDPVDIHSICSVNPGGISDSGYELYAGVFAVGRILDGGFGSGLVAYVEKPEAPSCVDTEWNRFTQPEVTAPDDVFLSVTANKFFDSKPRIWTCGYTKGSPDVGKIISGSQDVGVPNWKDVTPTALFAPGPVPVLRSIAYNVTSGSAADLSSGLVCVGDNGTILYSSDGGENWSKRTPANSYTGSFVEIKKAYSLNSNNPIDLTNVAWIAIGDDGEIQFSQNGNALNWYSFRTGKPAPGAIQASIDYPNRLYPSASLGRSVGTDPSWKNFSYTLQNSSFRSYYAGSVERTLVTTNANIIKPLYTMAAGGLSIHDFNKQIQGETIGSSNTLLVCRVADVSSSIKFGFEFGNSNGYEKYGFLPQLEINNFYEPRRPNAIWIKPTNNDYNKAFFGYGEGFALDLTDWQYGAPLQVGKKGKTANFLDWSPYDVYYSGSNIDIPQFNLYNPEIRGWKYGLYSAINTTTSAIWRRGRYGQFRDMLEQRLFTRYLQTETVNPYANIKLNQKLRQTVDGPIQVRFISSSAIYSASVDYVTATNPTYNPYDSGIYDIYYRSGQPFFDRPNED